MSGAAPTGHKRIKVLYVFATLQVGGAEELLVSEVEGLDRRTFGKRAHRGADRANGGPRHPPAPDEKQPI
jgi:hypothetical protein